MKLKRGTKAEKKPRPQAPSPRAPRSGFRLRRTSAGKTLRVAGVFHRVIRTPHILIVLSITSQLDAGDWTPRPDGWHKANTPASVGTHNTTFLRFWLPEGVEKVRGVMVVADHGDSGRFMYGAAEVRALAQRSGLCLALISVGRNFGNSRTSYNDETYSILKVLADSTVSDENVPDHPEIEFAPLLTWGWSATGTWAVHYANNAALAGQLDRCISWTRYHSHFRSFTPARVSPSLYEIPGLMMIGGADGTAGFEALTWHSLGRRNGAPWTVCIEPNVAHGDSGVLAISLNLEIPYFEAVINRRLVDASGSGVGWVSLNVFSETEGWLGLNDFDTRRSFGVAPYAEYTFGPRDQATWLPTEEVALLWQAASRATYYRGIALTTRRPTCTITNLEHGTTVGSSVMVDASATDTDGTIDRVYFLQDGQVVSKLTSSTGDSNYQYTFTGLTEGKHWLGARTYDDRGLWAHAFVSVTVAASERFLRGNCNDDGNVDISDAVCILSWLFLGEAEPSCLAATNADGVGAVNVTDPIYLLTHLFLGGPAPVDPFPDCGTSDLVADAELGCVETACP